MSNCLFKFIRGISRLSLITITTEARCIFVSERYGLPLLLLISGSLLGVSCHAADDKETRERPTHDGQICRWKKGALSEEGVAGTTIIEII